MSGTRFFRGIAAAMMAIAFLGLTDTGYLTAHKLFGTPLRCGVSSSCETVAQSSYSSVFGVPLSLFGMLFYLTLFFAAVTYREYQKDACLTFASAITIPSFLLSVYLVCVQLFVIHAVCMYCMASAGFSVILMALGVMTLIKQRALTRQTSVPSPSPNADGSE